MTLDLAAIEARAAEAINGPWTMPVERVCVAATQNEALLAVAEILHKDIPALLAAVRMLEAENAVLRRVPQRIVQDAYEANAEYDLASRCNKAEKRVTALEEAAQAVVDVTHGYFTNLTHLDEKVRLLAAALLSKEG